MQILVAIANQSQDTSKSVEQSAHESLARLKEYAADIGGKNLRSFCYSGRLGTLLYVESVHEKCQWSFVQEDERTVVVSLGYPRYWQSVLGVDERPSRESRRLTELCRKLQTEPLAALEVLAPPFLLAWIDKTSGELRLTNDGLGLAPVYEVQSGALHGWTNKIVGMSRACGMALEPCAEDWQTKLLTGGYFLGEGCGFKNVAFMKPGTLTHVTDSGIKTQPIDALRKWLTPIDQPAEELIETCNAALKTSVQDCVSYWSGATNALSGGWDSRMVTSATVAAGVRLPTYTIDRPRGIEATVAQRLAEKRQLDWSRVAHQMPETADELSEALRLSVTSMAGDGYQWGCVSSLWQNHQAHDDLIIGGQFGELPRGYLYKLIPASRNGDLSTDAIATMLADAVIANAPIQNPSIIQHAKEVVRQVCLDGYDYGCRGPALSEYYYLMGKMRRWAAVSIMGKTGQRIVHPCVDPQFIRASFSLRPIDKHQNAVAKELVKRNCPEWEAVPTAARRWRSKRYPSIVSSGLRAVASAQGRRNWRRPLDGSNYDYAGYLLTVASPIVGRTLESPSDLVASVFDVDAVRQQWQTCKTGSFLHPSKSAVNHKLIWDVLGLESVASNLL